ncbi:hypothetical protein LWI29_030766 [Acer saccharum]|uniref:Uncharacterized protein n=1 Tax=Acer saccharum TaxID=4024 RepID=A0AA39W7D3_ACESA|nr:hypothetical protein LWI29_030766 [Acer saccharum]
MVLGEGSGHGYGVGYRDDGSGTVKKIKIEVGEGDTCEQMMRNGTVDGGALVFCAGGIGRVCCAVVFWVSAVDGLKMVNPNDNNKSKEAAKEEHLKVVSSEYEENIPITTSLVSSATSTPSIRCRQEDAHVADNQSSTAKK